MAVIQPVGGQDQVAAYKLFFIELLMKTVNK